MKLALRFVLLFCFFRVLRPLPLFGQGPACRDANATIWYETPLDDAPNPYSCLILRVLSKDASTQIAIRCGAMSQSLDSSPTRQSDDGGRTWHKAPEDVPAQFPYFSLVQPVPGKSTQYRYIEDVGLYIRSDDAGKTWSLPEYRIDGISRMEFAAKALGIHFHPRDYTVQFGISAIGPDDPMKLYSGIALVPWGAMLHLSTTLDPKSPQVPSLPGLYESSDGGETWKKSMEGPLINSPLGISGSSPKILFAMGEEGAIKSEDGRRSWKPVGQNAGLRRKPLLKIYQQDPNMKEKTVDEEFSVSQFVIDPQDPDVVFIVSNKGFYRSLDGGRTWCLLNLGFDELDAASNMVLNPTKPQEIFFGTAHGVFHSVDRSENIEKIFPTPELK